MNAVVICPVSPRLNPRLLENQRRLMKSACEFAGDNNAIVHSMYNDWCPDWRSELKSHPDRARFIAAIRNRCILDFVQARERHEFLRNVTHVIWMDADVVHYDPDLFYRMLEASCANGNAVTAPLVFLDDSSGRTVPGRFYDTAGFIHHGERAGLYRPWFDGAPNDRPLPPLFEMDGSVGCVYCVPWAVYENGASHHYCDPKYTEHYPVCQHARAMGRKVLVLTDAVVRHAYLPDYGEEFH
jgi:hypothetical protein